MRRVGRGGRSREERRGGRASGPREVQEQSQPEAKGLKEHVANNG